MQKTFPFKVANSDLKGERSNPQSITSAQSINPFPFSSNSTASPITSILYVAIKRLLHFLVWEAKYISELICMFDGEVARLIKEQFGSTGGDIRR